MRRPILTLLLSAAALASMAQNPIIHDQFTADPTARVFDGRVYLFPSHDIPAPEDYPRKDWFCMQDYHVFSSTDLVRWTDHGTIVHQKDVPWGNPKGYSMWAPDCVEHQGKYYFYFPDQLAGQEQKGFGVGVAIADHPQGPYKVQPHPIPGVMGIDPVVLQTPSGQAYIFWAGGRLLGAPLKPNMMELDGEPVEVSAPLPQGFKEGPFVFQHNGKYYLTYPWVEDKTETLAYAMSDNPLGPYEYRGKIMEQSPNACWTNHHSIVQYHDQWYLFYHHNDYSPAFDKLRNVRIDSLFFNPDGTIQPIQPTLRGVGLTSAYTPIHIDRYSTIAPQGAEISFLSDQDLASHFQGWQITYRQAKAYSTYSQVDFGTTSPTHLHVHALAPQGGKLRIVDAKTSRTIASVKLSASHDFCEQVFRVSHAPTGVTDLRIESCDARQVSVDWIRFNATATPRDFTAQGNPLIRNKFTADPAPMVWGNRLYLYVGHDEWYEGQDKASGGKEFNITEWLCYSTRDMNKWTDHGSVLRPGHYAWADTIKAGVGTAWASQVVPRNGKFYYYTTLQGTGANSGYAIGVAVADSPTGPFRDAIGKPLINDRMTDNGSRGWWNDIDPTVLIDDDGQAYLCWGNGTCFMAKLKPNMTELDGDIWTVPLPRYTEGPWLHKHNGIYYLTYASSGFDHKEAIDYAMSRSIMGPWEHKGQLTGGAENSFTIHPGIIQFRGQWYLFYHNATLTLDGHPGAIGRRSVCFDKLTYNADGTMQFVNQTKGTE